MAKELALLLSDDLFAKLHQEAARLGTSAEQLVTDILEEQFGGTPLQTEYHQSQIAKDWTLWQRGEVTKVVKVEKAYVASWDAKISKSQQRLQAYLAEVSKAIGMFPEGPNLFLHMEIGVSEANLLRHHDVENYLTPLVKELGAHNFVFVSGQKYVGTTTSITIGIAERRISVLENDWHPFSFYAVAGVETKEAKERIRQALLDERTKPISAGEVEVILAWRCAPSKNWMRFWKPTGDTMGPVLDLLPKAKLDFNPSDDRITYLEFHRIQDEMLKNDIEVGMWWRKKP